MTQISWPIILSGDYTDGSICNAADYKNDFEKLRDAMNQLFERFSTFTIHGAVQRTASSGAGTTIEYASIGDTDTLDVSFWQIGPTATPIPAKSSYRRNIITVFKVPTWMQGVRLRGLTLNNKSNLPYNRLSNNLKLQWAESRPTFGISVGDLDEFFWADATTGQFLGPGSVAGAIDVATITLALGLAADTEAGTTLATSSTYTHIEELGGPNYMNGTTSSLRTTALATSDTLNTVTGLVYKDAACDYVVEPGKYIALWSSGDLALVNTTGGAVQGPVEFDFQVTAMCDAMVPTP